MLVKIRNMTPTSLAVGGAVGTLKPNATKTLEVSSEEMEAVTPTLARLQGLLMVEVEGGPGGLISVPDTQEGLVLDMNVAGVVFQVLGDADDVDPLAVSLSPFVTPGTTFKIVATDRPIVLEGLAGLEGEAVYFIGDETGSSVSGIGNFKLTRLAGNYCLIEMHAADVLS